MPQTSYIPISIYKIKINLTKPMAHRTSRNVSLDM